MANNMAERIKAFVNFLDITIERRGKSHSLEERCNGKIQDLMHELELNKSLTYHDKAKIACKIAEVREERREIKDFAIESEAIVAWCKKFGAAYSELRGVIGSTSKSESRMTTRSYNQRTDVVTEVFGKGWKGIRGNEEFGDGN